MGTSLEQQAATCLTQGDYETAIALYSQAIEIDSTARANYWSLGLAQLLYGDAWEAQAVWLSVLTNATPETIDDWTAELQAVLNKATQTSLSAARFQQATQIYEQLLELDDEQAPIHDALGQVLALQGRLEEAIAHWQQAIAIDPTYIKAHRQAAETLQKIEQFEEAVTHYLAILECVPADWSATYNLGLCCLQLNRLDDAVLYLNQAIHLDANFAPAHGDLGVAWLRQGALEKAISAWHQAITLNSGLAQPYAVWANTLKQQSRLDHTTSINAEFLNGLSNPSELFKAYLPLGKLLVSQSVVERIGIPDEVAIATFEKVLEDNPNSAEGYLELGKQQLKIGRLEQAIAAFQQALLLQPGNVETYIEMGKTLAQKHQFQEAIASYQQAIERDVNLAEIYFHLGDALALKGDSQAAIQAYQTKIKLQPEAFDSYDAHYRLGVLLADQGQLSEAIAHFHTAMKLAPRLATAVYQVWLKFNHNQPDLDWRSPLLPVDPPQGFYQSTEEWATEQGSTSHYCSIYPAETIQLKLPKTLEPNVDLRFRFGESLELPRSFVASVPQGRYWIDEWNRTAVITPENKILGDVSPDFPILSPGHPDKHPSQHSTFALQKLPPIQSIQGSVAILSALFNDAYFHWMFDVIPRLELIRSSGIDLTEIDYFLINQGLPFQQESLARLGISATQILEPKNYPHIAADYLIVPSFPGVISWMPRWTCEFLQNLFLDQTQLAQAEKIDRLYITRNQTSNRRVINEVEVVDLLEKWGFQSVALESMAIAEQAALIRHAKIIVAPHGGGLTNIVFCQPGTKVIELFSPNYVYPCYWFISNLLQLEHYYLLGEVPLGFQFNKLLHPNARTEDILINIDRLTDTLKLANVI